MLLQPRRTKTAKISILPPWMLSSDTFTSGNTQSISCLPTRSIYLSFRLVFTVSFQDFQLVVCVDLENLSVGPSLVETEISWQSLDRLPIHLGQIFMFPKIINPDNFGDLLMLLFFFSPSAGQSFNFFSKISRHLREELV